MATPCQILANPLPSTCLIFSRRFPERFMFQLTKEEFEKWKSQIVTSKIYSQKEIDALKMSARRCPYAFTEQGVAQLSAVLHSDVAEDASVRIMDAFVAMRRFITANAGLFQRVDAIEQRQIQTEQKLDVVLDKIEELSPAVTTEELFGTGCVWNAYTFLSGLVRRAQRRIILIDNFVDERTLLLLDKRAAGVDCIVHTRFSKQTELDFEKHNEQNAEIRKIQHVEPPYYDVSTTPTNRYSSFIILNSELKKVSLSPAPEPFGYLFSRREHLRAHHLRHHHCTMVDDVVGNLEARIADFFVSDTIITHRQMSDIIPIIHKLQKLFVTLGDSYFVFLN